MSTEEKPNEISLDQLQSEFAFELPTNQEPPQLPASLEITGAETQEEEEQENEDVIQDSLKAKEPQPLKEVSNYNKIVKTFLEKGEWEDVLIKTEDGEVKLSELEDIPEEEFLNLLEDQKALKNQDQEGKYVPVDGLSDDRRLLIDIVAKGGDLREIFQSPQEMQRPFSEDQGWDLKNEQHLASIVLQQYITQGFDQKRAEKLLQEDISDLTVEEKALNIVKAYQDNYDNRLKEIATNLEKEQLEEKERLKQYRSELNKKYKEANIPEALTKKLVDLGTRYSETGGFVIDDIYETKMKDPKEAAEILFFLSDKEKYLAEKMKETKINTQTNNLRVIERIPKESRTVKTEEEAKNKGSFTFELPTQ